MARKKFLRGKWRAYSKLGHGRKKLQKYRRATGRHNKIREKKKGNTKRVEIGYKKQRKAQVEIKKISNLQELKNIKKGDSIMLSKIGQKKKIEIAKKAQEKGIKILNLNIKKFIKEVEKKKKETKKKKRKEKKTKEDKKTKKTEKQEQTTKEEKPTEKKEKPKQEKKESKEGKK